MSKLRQQFDGIHPVVAILMTGGVTAGLILFAWLATKGTVMYQIPNQAVLIAPLKVEGGYIASLAKGDLVENDQGYTYVGSIRSLRLYWRSQAGGTAGRYMIMAEDAFHGLEFSTYQGNIYVRSEEYFVIHRPPADQGGGKWLPAGM